MGGIIAAHFFAYNSVIYDYMPSNKTFPECRGLTLHGSGKYCYIVAEKQDNEGI